MQKNGRLTAPPQLEAVLVTNSVCCKSLKGRMDRPEARGTTLAQPSLGNRPGRCSAQTFGQVYASAHSLGKLDPVSATHRLSSSQGVAAGF